MEQFYKKILFLKECLCNKYNIENYSVSYKSENSIKECLSTFIYILYYYFYYLGGGRTRVMISPSTTTITSESSETTTVTSKSGLTSVGVGGVVFKPPGYVPPLTTPESVTVSTPTSPVALGSTDLSLSTSLVEKNLITVLSEKVNNFI